MDNYCINDHKTGTMDVSQLEVNNIVFSSNFNDATLTLTWEDGKIHAVYDPDKVDEAVKVFIEAMEPHLNGFIEAKAKELVTRKEQ